MFEKEWFRSESLSSRIVKRFGDFTALNGVSFDIQPGSLHIGPLWLRKTTLLRIIAGFREPEEGEVWFGNQS